MLIVTVVISVCFLMLLYGLYRGRETVLKMEEELTILRKANEKLSDRAELLGLAERISHLGSWEFFVENKMTRWSEELYKIYGFKDSTVQLSAEITERMIAPEYKEKVTKELQSAIANKTSFAVEFQIIQTSGIRKYVLSQGFYIEKENKLIGTIQDVTELKEAVLKLKLNESLLREAEMVSHSGSWEWTDGKDFILWSDEMYNIHGLFPNSVFVNFSFYESLVHKDDLENFRQNFFHAQKNKAPFKINYRIVTPAGEIRHVLSKAEYKRIGLDNKYAYIGNTQDVTQLREAQVQLEEKITELNRSNQDLEQFAYVASHDLQEPLRKIQAFGGRLKDKYGNQLNDEARDYLQRMFNAAERMRTLINDLLAFSRATKDHKKIVNINLGELINKTVKEMDFIIEQKSATITVDLDLEIGGIYTQMTQLFENLLGNALKFINPDTFPSIQISGDYRYGNELPVKEATQNQLYAVIEIKDNGIGFDEEDSVKIFDVFHRLHSNTEYNGTGIGLAICKKIIDNHSGFISARSTIGKGSTFTIVLPKKHKPY